VSPWSSTPTDPWLINLSDSPVYDDDEPAYDPDEPAEPDVETGHVDDIDIGENPDQLLTTGDSSREVVESGDVSAARGNKGMAAKDKKIPPGERKTTPYMTKYERARILGTRALQIRWGFSLLADSNFANSSTLLVWMRQCLLTWRERRILFRLRSRSWEKRRYPW